MPGAQKRKAPPSAPPTEKRVKKSVTIDLTLDDDGEAPESRPKSAAPLTKKNRGVSSATVLATPRKIAAPLTPPQTAEKNIRFAGAEENTPLCHKYSGHMNEPADTGIVLDDRSNPQASSPSPPQPRAHATDADVPVPTDESTSRGNAAVVKTSADDTSTATKTTQQVQPSTTNESPANDDATASGMTTNDKPSPTNDVTMEQTSQAEATIVAHPVVPLESGQKVTPPATVKKQSETAISDPACRERVDGENAASHVLSEDVVGPNERSDSATSVPNQDGRLACESTLTMVASPEEPREHQQATSTTTNPSCVETGLVAGRDESHETTDSTPNPANDQDATNTTNPAPLPTQPQIQPSPPLSSSHAPLAPRYQPLTSTAHGYDTRNPQTFTLKPAFWRAWKPAEYRHLATYLRSTFDAATFARSSGKSVEEVNQVLGAVVVKPLYDAAEARKRGMEGMEEVFAFHRVQGTAMRGWREGVERKKVVRGELEGVGRGVVRVILEGGALRGLDVGQLGVGDVRYLKTTLGKDDMVVLMGRKGKCEGQAVDVGEEEDGGRDGDEE